MVIVSFPIKWLIGIKNNKINKEYKNIYVIDILWAIIKNIYIYTKQSTKDQVESKVISIIIIIFYTL